MTLSQLMSVWRARNVEQWLRSPGKYRSFAEKILAQGEPLLAYDVVNDALAKWGTQTMAWADDDMAIVAQMARECGLKLPQAEVTREICRALNPVRYQLDKYGR